jgi:diaminopropionate ammonia-lyase
MQYTGFTRIVLSERVQPEGGNVLFRNPHRDPAAAMPAVSRVPLDFHRRLPDYRPTRLVRLDDLAAELGVRHVWIKDESYRLGLPAFKLLGVAWATYRALCDRLGSEPHGWTSLAELRRAFAPLRGLTLVTATDGNHGRAVAHVATWFGLAARIIVPQQIPSDRLAAIRAEGADVDVIDGSYDDAVEAASQTARSANRLLLTDTASDADEIVPRWIVEGYSTLFWEIDDELSSLGTPQPALVVVQIGVGSLAAAAAAHYRRDGTVDKTRLVGIEPASAACVLESVRAGEIRLAAGPHTSIMDCLNAGLPSRAAFPHVMSGFDAFASIEDDEVAHAVACLAKHGVVSGATGAAGLAGLRAVREDLELTDETDVLLINTEGFADPGGYTAVLQSSNRAAAPG